MFVAYKFRIYPKKKHRNQIAQHFGCTRWVFNWVLEERQKFYKEPGKTLSRRELQDKLVREMKVKYPWLCELNSQTLLAALFHADCALKRFLKGLSGFPQFRSAKCHWQRYHCPQNVRVDFKGNAIHLPKIGRMKAKVHRKVSGKIKTCVVTLTPHGHFYISVLADDGQPFPPKKPIVADTTTGVDVGLKSFFVTSNSTVVDNPRFLDKSLKNLGKKQKIASRKKKGSKGKEQARKAVAKTHFDIAVRRTHFLHAGSNRILSESQATVAFEDLNTKGMLKNKCLARHISNVSWSRLVNFVQYKADRVGKNVIFCPRFAPSSKLCTCGYKYNELTLSMREWTCPQCLRHHDRDLLAANNIKKFALAEAFGQSACVKSSPRSDTCQRKYCGERLESSNSSGSREAPSNMVAP